MKVNNSLSLVGLPSTRDFILDGEKVRLREKKLSDARNDYRWHADEELSALDAARPLEMAFTVFLLDYSLELRSPRFRRFPLAVDTLDGKHIGNCSVYDVDEKSGQAQVGIIIGDRDYWNRGYGTDAMKTLVDFLFRTTRLERLYLKTLEWNTRAHRSFERVGFVPCGAMRRSSYDFKLMEITREQWQVAQPRQGVS
jgi:RimJ/RimL family protein N-acetyltransferase